MTTQPNPDPTNKDSELEKILGAYGSYLTTYSDHKGRFDPLDLEQAVEALQAMLDIAELKGINQALNEVEDYLNSEGWCDDWEDEWRKELGEIRAALTKSKGSTS